MMRTFYIASASRDPEQRDRVHALGKKLFQDFGWQWHENYDWTVGFEAETNYPKHELVYRAKMDLIGARDADIFIFWDTGVPSLGANREYGIRWGQERTLYRLSTLPEHLFDMLQHVVSIETLEELLEVLKIRETK
jgi:hypothetical protein